jgi:hypothetical protein
MENRSKHETEQLIKNMNTTTDTRNDKGSKKGIWYGRLLTLQIRVGGGGAYSAPPCENCFADTTHQIYMYIEGCEHSSFKNVDLVAIQSSDPQAQTFNWPIFGKVRYFPPKSSEG